jgi:demethylmenaquinone methyltransferase/2-methoxy-6-polyprenyl-1,4-benzoquinol methylase
MVERGVRSWLRTAPADFSRELFKPLPRRYNLLAYLLSFGQDQRWRSTMVGHVEDSRPRLVLDVACGPCAVTKRLANKTSAHIVGVDLSDDMIREGQRNITAAGLSERIALVLARGQDLPFADATFDALTFTYLLRYVDDPAATLRELARVVEPGGVIASLEFAVPRSVGWHACWWFYTRAILPVAGYLLGGKGWWDVGRFLGPSIARHYKKYPIDWIVNAWEHAGIEHVEYRRMSLGGGIVMWGYRSG